MRNPASKMKANKQAGLEKWLNISEHYCSCRGPGILPQEHQQDQDCFLRSTIRTLAASSSALSGPGLILHQQDHSFLRSIIRTRVHSAAAPPGPWFFLHQQDQGSFFRSTISSRVHSAAVAPSGPGLGPQPSGLGFILQQHPSGPRCFSLAVPAAHNHLQFWPVWVLVWIWRM